MILETITLTGSEKTLSQLQTAITDGDYDYILAKNSFLYMTTDKGLVKVNKDKSIVQNISVNFPVASKTTSGIAKLYTEVGTNTDGAMSQSSVKSELDKKANKGTSISDYGITDAYTKTEVDTELEKKANKGTKLSDYGITDGYTKSEVDTKLSSKIDSSSVYTKTESDSKYAVKVDGKQLSTNDYTTAEKNKLADIAEGANNYVLPDDVVHDANYVHTDTNFTAEDKAEVDKIANKVDTSALADYVKFTDTATTTKSGVLKVASATACGLALDSDGYLKVNAASEQRIDERASRVLPIVPYNLDYAVRSVSPKVVTELGDTVSKNCIYDLGKQAAISIALPATGSVGDWLQFDFMSGSTATTLTLTSTAGIMGFDLIPEINTIYSLYLDWGIIGESDSAMTYGWRFSYSEYPINA